MSLLIKDVQVVDGEGNEPYKADVLVQKNVISAIGNLKSRGASRVIDGLGHYLTPGFIDIHTTSDHYLSIFENPKQEDFTNQGVTTILGGHCGSSLAPLIYGTLESIRKWANPTEINVNWHTVSEFLNTLKKTPLGVSFGTLAGHSTIRRSIAGDRTRIQTKELAVLKGVLKEALKDGAFGLSTGLGYIHGNNASQKEIKELAEIVKEAGGVYATHLRSEGGKLTESVDETIKTAEETGVKTVISHFRPIKGFGKEFREALDRIAETEFEVYFDIYPHDTSVDAIYTILPEWVQKGSIEAMLERVRNKGLHELIKKELKKIDPKSMYIAGAPKHEYLIGKSLSEIAKNLNKNSVEALLHVMDVTSLRAIVSQKNVDNKLLKKALMHNRAFIASSGNSNVSNEFMKQERVIDTFPKYIRMAMENKSFMLPEVIEKITSKPARFFDIKNRGVIKEGNAADLVLLNKNDFQIKHVVVGGKVAGEEEVRGEILRHKG